MPHRENKQKQQQQKIKIAKVIRTIQRNVKVDKTQKDQFVQKSKFIKICFSINLNEVTEMNLNRKVVPQCGSADSKCTISFSLKSRLFAEFYCRV